MAGRKQSRGVCVFCSKEMTKGGLSRHLSSCAARQAANAAADAAGPGKPETIFHLQIQDRYTSDFWLHLEMRGSAPLRTLDSYLRTIWLECCGHLSRFSFGGWDGDEIAMSRQLGQAVAVGDELTHIYDFGTSSETLVKAVATRTGKPLTKHPITLMARNQIPEVTCQECGKPAAWLCIECIYEYDKPGWLCQKHGKRHPHDDYGELMPVVNSPRLGMCGYVGPADPPY